MSPELGNDKYGTIEWEDDPKDRAPMTEAFDTIESLRRELEAARADTKAQKEIREAEKNILLNEIEINTRLRADLAASVEALNTIEDRHHPDSEWCPEAKEVLGGNQSD